MASYSHLGAKKRRTVRRRLRRTALNAARNRGAIHYTQGFRRWDGIRLHRRGPGHYPNYADCSALASWLLWDAFKHVRMNNDIVNGARWTGGFTGTMLRHGKHLSRPTLVGDCVFYGSWPNGSHVAIYIGNNLVVSHGSEAGPLIVRWNYRSVLAVRRYI